MIKKACLVGLVTFGLALSTLCPTVFVGDSGELITSAATLGIPHNPGYPIYNMLAHLFTCIPCGSIAYKVNLFSAASTSLACSLIFIFFTRLGCSQAVAASLSLIYFSAPIVWVQGVTAEVYTPFTTILALMLLLSLNLMEKRSAKGLMLWIFALSLAIVSHYSVFLLIPGFILLARILGLLPSIPQGYISILLVIFILGLSIFLYLPLRSQADPVMNWSTPSKLQGFVRHIGAFEHRHKSVANRSLEFYLERSLKIILHVANQISLPVLLLALVGMAVSVRNKILLFSLIAIIIGNFIFIVIFNTTPLNVTGFGYPSLMVLLGFAGIALEKLLKTLKSRSLRSAVCILILAYAVVWLLYNYPSNDRRDFWFGYDYAVNILRTMPYKGVLKVHGDNQTFTLIYTHEIESYRPDVILCNYAGRDLGQSRREVQIPKELNRRENTYHIPWPDFSPQEGYQFENIGYLSQARSQPPGIEELDRIFSLYRTRNHFRDDIPLDMLSSELVGTYFYIYGMYCLSKGDMGAANQAFEMASRKASGVHFLRAKLGLIYEKMRDYQKALVEYQAAIEISADYAFALYRAGVVAERLGLDDLAIDYFTRTVGVNPNDAVALNYLGMLYDRKGEARVAIEYFLRSIEADKDFVEPRSNLGAVYYKMGEDARAEKVLLEAIELAPDHATTYLNLGALYAYGKKEPLKAVKAWEKYLQLAPDNPQADNLKIEIDRLEKEIDH